MNYLLAGLIGIIGGITSGLFGVGGGVVMVPAMLLLLGSQITDIKQAIGTSLAVIVPTALVGSWKHHTQGNVKWEVMAALVLTIFITQDKLRSYSETGLLILGLVLWFTALQTHVPRESLSRVSAYDAMGSLMFGPIGLALAGPLIGVVGLQTGFLVAAAVITVALLATLLSASVRNVRSAPVSA